MTHFRPRVPQPGCSRQHAFLPFKGAAARLLVLAAAFALSGCGAPSPSSPTASTAATSQTSATSAAKPLLRIAAASDLKFALDDVIKAFAADHPGAEVTAVYGSSGSFFAQLSQKGPFDLFLSADVKYPKKLIEQGQAIAESEFLYAIGRAVVWVRNESKLDLEKNGIKALAHESVKSLAIADPQLAPYGRAGEAALKSAGVYDAVKDRLVLGENIAQTAQFVESGAADAGILSLSLALAPPLKSKGRYWLIPAESHPRIEQGGAILTWAADRRLAEEFCQFLRKGAGKDILKQHGFTLPNGT